MPQTATSIVHNMVQQMKQRPLWDLIQIWILKFKKWKGHEVMHFIINVAECAYQAKEKVGKHCNHNETHKQTKSQDGMRSCVCDIR